MKLPFVPIRSINAVVGKCDKCVVPPALPKVNVEHENGVAVVDDRSCDVGKRDVARFNESDNGDRL